MFDILDGNMDFGNMGGLSNSRSSSMKKINKKDSKPSIKSQFSTTHANKKQYDDLLSGMLSKDSKTLNITDKPFSNFHKNKGQTLDVHFDLSSHSREISRANTNSGHERVSIGNQYSLNEIGIEDHGVSHNFGETQHTIINPSRATQSFVSSRNMKPPIKKKESLPYSQSFNFATSSLGIAIPEEDPTMANSSLENDDLKLVTRSSRRRSSIDARSQINDDVFALDKKADHNGNSKSYNFDSIKEDPFVNIHKSQSCFLQESKVDRKTEHNNFFMAKEKLQMKSENIKTAEEQVVKKLDNKQGFQEKAEQMRKMAADYDRQIDLLKLTYKGQIEHLQQCLDRQIAENRTMREAFMLETNRLIEQERGRSTKIHEEEVSRLKDMFSWQKKRVEDTYRMEIESLKSSLDFAKQNGELINKNKMSQSKESLQFLEYQLKTKQQMVQSKLKGIEMRELQLQTRQAQLSNRYKREQDRIREQQKRIMQMQLQFKKQVLQSKKGLSHEKQQLATELGSLQNDYLRRKEHLQILQRQLELQRAGVEEEKREMQRVNGEVMVRHREGVEEIQEEKERLKELELELVRKVRLVQLRAKEIGYQSGCHGEVLANKRQGNWINQHQGAERGPTLSGEKKLNNAKSMSNILKTKQRFYKLEKNSRSKLNLSINENKKIDLTGYMTRIQNNTRYNWQA